MYPIFRAATWRHDVGEGITRGGDCDVVTRMEFDSARKGKKSVRIMLLSQKEAAEY